MSRYVNLNNITVQNSEKVDNIISKRLFYSSPGNIGSEDELNNLFNLTKYTNTTAYGTPSGGIVAAFSYSNYGDAPAVSVGFQMLSNPSNNKIYYRSVASSVNGGNKTWTEVITAAAINSYIKSYLDGNGYKPG